MKRTFALFGLFLLACGLVLAAAKGLRVSPPQAAATKKSYLGFDRNIYPGDEALAILRKTFSFASYWLSAPPGENTNTWSGKRELLKRNGYGFVVLFRGRAEKDLKNIEDASAKGEADAQAAVESARRDGFAPQTIVYLDIVEGGRLSPNYHAYIIGWLWHLTPALRGGFYCSGIPVKEGQGKSITTCQDIFADLGRRSREFSIWAYNDACPPSPGCVFPQNPPSPDAVDGDGEKGTSIWQYAQSPRRKEFAARCPGYAKDGNCYAPSDAAQQWFLDLDSATSADPSGGAK
jgi:hypothetical protein